MSNLIESSSIAILVDLDEWGRICDFNIEFHDQIEACDKTDPTKLKIGLELDPKTLTKKINCGNCNSVLNFNMIVRTARARRRNRSKRKPKSELMEAELQKLKKIQKSNELVSDDDEIKNVQQIVQEEIIIENNDDNSIVYQCPVASCKTLFESMQEWQQHYGEIHQKNESMIKATPSQVSSTIEENSVDDNIDLVLENENQYVAYPKCSICKATISQLDSVEGQLYDLCYFCQYQKNQKSAKIDVSACESSSSSFVTQSILDDKKIRKTNTIFRCPVCFTDFPTNKLLADHMRSSCKLKLVNCDLCTYKSVSEDDLNQHREKVHGIKSIF